MFTFADIRNIAVQIEKNGEACYHSAARLASDSEVAEALHWMAEEERRHAAWFESLRSARPLTAEQRELEAMGRSLLQEMLKGSTFLLARDELEHSETLMEVVTRSQVFEQDTILFYEFLLGLIDDPDTALRLREIITEEQSHLHRLAQMAKRWSAEHASLCPSERG